MGLHSATLMPMPKLCSWGSYFLLGIGYGFVLEALEAYPWHAAPLSDSCGWRGVLACRNFAASDALNSVQKTSRNIKNSEAWTE